MHESSSMPTPLAGTSAELDEPDPIVIHYFDDEESLVAWCGFRLTPANAVTAEQRAAEGESVCADCETLQLEYWFNAS